MGASCQFSTQRYNFIQFLLSKAVLAVTSVLSRSFSKAQISLLGTKVDQISILLLNGTMKLSKLGRFCFEKLVQIGIIR
jgi:hypothetical protein